MNVYRVTAHNGNITYVVAKSVIEAIEIYNEKYNKSRNIFEVKLIGLDVLYRQPEEMYQAGRNDLAEDIKNVLNS